MDTTRNKTSYLSRQADPEHGDGLALEIALSPPFWVLLQRVLQTSYTATCRGSA